MCHKWKVAGTYQKFSTAKKRRFLGLKSVILLSKMRRWAHDSPKFILIWELPMVIYEGFMKVPRSPIPAQRSYSHFKKSKIKRIKKTAARFEPGYFSITNRCFHHYSTTISYPTSGSNFYRTKVLKIFLLAYVLNSASVLWQILK